MLKGFDYLKEKRSITTETIQKFHLGYCDLNGSIYIDSEFPETTLQLDPRFNDSVLFPIFDLYNQFIGVSARTLNNPKLKYVNTVYPKTQHLYGLNTTWTDCLQQNKVYVVEGNIDVLRLYQSGIRNVVGMLGSVLKEQQLILLSRFVKNIVVVPDGDLAGRKVLQRIEANTSFQNKLNINISTLQLPKDTDPDLFVLSNGVEKLKALEKSKSYSLQERLQKYG